MSKTRSKQGIEEKWGDRSNVSKTIVNKALSEVWDIAPMGQWELAHLCLRLGRSKALSKYGGITPMFLRPL